MRLKLVDAPIAMLALALIGLAANKHFGILGTGSDEAFRVNYSATARFTGWTVKLAGKSACVGWQGKAFFVGYYPTWRYHTPYAIAADHDRGGVFLQKGRAIP